MIVVRACRAWAALAAVGLISATVCAPAGADEETEKALKEQMRAMQQQMQEMQRQIQEMRQQGAGAAAAAPPPTPAPAPGEGPAGPTGPAKSAVVAKEAPKEPLFDKFLKGFFGTLDLSVDYTTKGMGNLEAFQWSTTNPTGGPPYVQGAQKAGPYGKVSWLGAMSSNGSNIGYRGVYNINHSSVDFIYQVSTALNMAAAPGLQDTWTKSSNTVQGAIGLGDTWLGFQGKSWGKVKFGEMFLPYKTSTDRLNPFGSGLGNYSSIMGNTGGDNRVEFGTRADDVVFYTSPSFAGLSFDAAYQFGQNIDPNNDLTPLGSSDCNGSNNPGSGNLFLNCDDGGYDRAYSADIKYETHGLYLVAAYEIHKRVNRSSDGIGSNSPYYNALLAQGDPAQGATNPSPLLDWADYDAYAAEYPNAAPAGTPAYSTQYDVADEWAGKLGGQYSFDFGLTVSYLWETMKRKLPQIMQFQDERQRVGQWVALQQLFNEGRDSVAIGWAHASATVGDPGGQHNFNPNGIGDNQANMYAANWTHKFDKQLSAYFEFADTVNDGNAHYDIGAGGHGVKTDCHDATHTAFIDYSSAGPTTWGGCHPIGISTGVNFKF